MLIKRFQHWTRNGKEWSKWFPWEGSTEEKFQLKNNLSNEYKEVSSEGWIEIEKEQENKK